MPADFTPGTRFRHRRDGRVIVLVKPADRTSGAVLRSQAWLARCESPRFANSETRVQEHTLKRQWVEVRDGE